MPIWLRTYYVKLTEERMRKQPTSYSPSQSSTEKLKSYQKLINKIQKPSKIK